MRRRGVLIKRPFFPRLAAAETGQSGYRRRRVPPAVVFLFCPSVGGYGSGVAAPLAASVRACPSVRGYGGGIAAPLAASVRPLSVPSAATAAALPRRWPPPSPPRRRRRRLRRRRCRAVGRLRLRRLTNGGAPRRRRYLSVRPRLRRRHCRAVGRVRPFKAVAVAMRRRVFFRGGVPFAPRPLGLPFPSARLAAAVVVRRAGRGAAALAAVFRPPSLPPLSAPVPSTASASQPAAPPMKRSLSAPFHLLKK